MSYDVNTVGINIIKACRKLVNSGLIARTWGNVSARLDDNTFLITPSGKSYENMRVSDLVEVSINNLQPISEGTPSSEKGIHGIAYFLRPEVNFIIHTHQLYASSLSVLDTDHLNGIVEAKTLPNGRKLPGAALLASIKGNEFPIAEYGMNGSQALINSVGHVLRKNPTSNSILMSNHGALCLGKTYEDAFNTAFDLENRAKDKYKELCGDKYIDNDDAMDSFVNNFSVSANPYIEIIDASEISFVLKSPYAVAISKATEEIFPYIDDFAQLAGISMRPISFLEQLQSALTTDYTSFDVKKSSEEEAAQAINLRECAILRNKGIVCHSSFDDMNALCIVVEKQCQAAYLANTVGNVAPIASEHVRLDRENYIISYSKLK